MVVLELFGGHNLPPLVEIGLIYLQKMGVPWHPRHPQGRQEDTFNTFLHGRGTCVMAEKPVSPFPNLLQKKGKMQQTRICRYLLE